MRTAITKIEGTLLDTGNKTAAISMGGVLIDFRVSTGYSRTDISLNRYYEINELGSKFYFDSENLESFLLENLELVKFLQRAHLQLSKILPGSIFILEVISDYEVDEWETLFVNVLNNFQDPFFNQKLQEFIIEWMFAEKPEIRKLVTIKEIC